MAYCSKKMFAGGQDSSVPVPKCPRDFGTGAELSGHLSTSHMVPKCLGSEMSWVRSVLTPNKSATGINQLQQIKAFV